MAAFSVCLSQRQKKLNHKQNEQLTLQTKTLAVRKEEVAELDFRIAELQDRLRHSALQRQNGKNARQSSSGAVIATVEPYVQENIRNPPSEILGPSKQDPRYQSLPPERRLPPGTQRTDQGSRVKAENSASVVPIQVQLWNQDVKQHTRVPSAGNASGKYDGKLSRVGTRSVSIPV